MLQSPEPGRALDEEAIVVRPLIPDSAVSYRDYNRVSRRPSDITVELEQESDGRRIGELPQRPGTLVYGASSGEPTAQAKALALRVLADRLDRGEADSALDDITFAAA